MADIDKTAFDPLDMRNYSLEKFKEIKAGPIMQRLKLIGVPLAVLSLITCAVIIPVVWPF